MRAGVLSAFFLVLSLISGTLSYFDDQTHPNDIFNQNSAHQNSAHDHLSQQKYNHPRRLQPSFLESALRFGLLSGLGQGSGGAYNSGAKGLEYFMEQYGQLAQVLAEDVFDTMGIARNIQLAIPMVLKVLSLGMYFLMNINTGMRTYQPTVKSIYGFLQNFNKPTTSVYNDVTDQVFSALDRQMNQGNYLF